MRSKLEAAAAADDACEQAGAGRCYAKDKTHEPSLPNPDLVHPPPAKMSFLSTAAAHAAADAVGVDVGMQVVKSAKGWEVKSFTRYGTAELSKQIQPGDVLMAINEKNTTLFRSPPCRS